MADEWHSERVARVRGGGGALMRGLLAPGPAFALAG
jgi:hypothetical protein